MTTMNDPTSYISARGFLESAGKWGTSEAILASDRRPLSYAQLCRHVDHIVSLLNSRGLGRNDRVAIVLPGGPELAVTLLSVIAGFTCVPLSNESRKQEYELFLSDVHARALIVQRGMNTHARAAAKSCNVPVIDLIPRPSDEAGLFDLEFTGEISGHAAEPGFALPDDNAVITHSSGTTSRPKLIPWSQKELFSAAHAVRSAFALGPADRCLNVMPLYHLHGLVSCLLASLYGGGSVVCTKGFDPDRFFDWIREHKPTWYSGVSAIHHAALQLAEKYPDKAMQAGLRFIRHSSTPLSPSVLKKLEERFIAPVIDEKLWTAERTHPSRISRESPLPLSFGQESLWFLDQLEPGSPAYNISRALRLRGKLNTDALEHAFMEVIQRHETLRTVFISQTDGPVQRINPPGDFNLEFIDVSGLPEEQREDKARQLANEEASRPFDLVTGPLLRATVLRLKTEEHVLLLTMHHIVSDGWSMGILYRELSILYDAFLKGNPSPLPELPIQYADFAVWQKEWLQGENLERQLTFWKEQLSGAAMPELPTDSMRPPVRTLNGTRYTLQLSGGLTKALLDLGRSERASLFMTVLTAFKVLLRGYTGHDDIVVGTPVANRNQAEIEGLIGFFVNMLVLRTDTSGDPAFRELLKRVKRRLLDAYTYQELPFEKLVKELRPERAPGLNPLFQVGFAIQNVPFSDLVLSGLTVSRIEIENVVTKFDLEVYLIETAEGLQVSFVYNTDLFNTVTIERMAGHYQRILEGIAADPDQSLSRLIVGDAVRWNEQVKKLTDLWADVLGRKKIDIHDHFFESGGDSLKAFRCLLRMKSILGTSVPYEVFYKNPTVYGVISSLDSLTISAYELPATMSHQSYPRSGPIPLSISQEEIWSTQQIQPDLPVFNESFTITIKKGMDVKVLEQAFRELVRRHAILRTAFRETNSRPAQFVLDEVSWNLSFVDLRSVSSSARKDEAKLIAENQSGRPFDLGAPPLMRATLVQFDTDEYKLYVVFHHLLIDAITVYHIFVPELWTLYASGLAGNVSGIHEQAVPYADYVQWQQGQLSGEFFQKSLAYWENQLAGTPLLDFPTDRPRSSVSEFKGEFRRLSYSKELTASLHALGRQHRATFFMVLLSALNVLLWRYVRNDVIVIGSFDGGRSRPEFERMAGCCLNSLVLRTELSGNPSFVELLRRVKETALQAYTHKDLPFGVLAKKLKYPRDIGRHPLFRAALVLEPSFEEDESGWNVSQLEVQTGTTKFELAFEFEERPEGIIGRVEYDTSLFDRTTIERLIGQYEVLLGAIVDDPERLISEFPLLTENEKHRLLVEWNDTRANYPEGKWTSRLFAEQAARTPDAIAVIFGEDQLTYRELNSRANQMAQYLKARGAGPGIKVGICIERSMEAIICIMAVFKAGGVYVPLDPAYPQERLSYMLKDSMAGMLVMQGPHTGMFPDGDITIITIDTEKDEISSQSGSDPECVVQAADSAYVIYTSGSTGSPKGVVISQEAIAGHCLHMVDHYGLRQGDRVLQFASLNFDASLEQVLTPLLAGAAVVLRDRDLWAPLEFHERVFRYGLTVVNLPPSYFNEWVKACVEAEDIRIPDQLRLIICGGDELQPGTVLLWEKSPMGSARLLNAYGPTETTITATTFEVNNYIRSKHEIGDMRKKIPIGRPLPNRKVYILDSVGNPVPVGVPGELCIGGAGVAQGYFNRPELTAEKFVQDPFNAGPGERVYKTGDFARYLPDGNIEFMGRIDHQVKIRGFRIETGEVEVVLGQHPGIQETVVTVREVRPGDNRLVAYTVLKPGETAAPNELRSFLHEKLPEYMVPSVFVMQDSLPLTPVGKIDRKSLPEPDLEHPDTENERIAPRTPTEKLLADIWREVLGTGQVGIHDNFFSLGGHSLLATQVMSRIKEAFHIDVPLRRLFETPTVAGLSDAVSTVLDKKQGPTPEQTVTVSEEGEFPLSFAQQRLWFLNQLEPDSPAYNISIAFRINGRMNVNAMERSIGEIMRRHEVLRSVFTALTDEPVQRINPAAVFTLQQVDISNLPEQQREPEAKKLAQYELHHIFDLATGPLLRAVLVRLKPEEHILILTVHHIVYDAWSTGILYRELSACYEAFSKGVPASLPELPMQYADYALWQRKWLQGGKMEEQIRFWKEHLSDITPLDLPADHPRPEVQTFNGAKYAFHLPGDVTESLRGLSRRERVTMFMALLAAFQVMLHRYTGQSDIVIGTPIANRNLAAIEGLIGFFVNTLVIRIDTSGNPAFRELLARVRNVLLDAYSHQDLPFEKLVEELKSQRDLSRNPLFQVLFTLQNAPVSNLELAGLTVSRMELEDTRTRFDLEVHLIEEADGLRGAFIYNTDLFDAATISRMAGHYQMILKGIAAGPDQRLSELPMLTDIERRQLLVEWNHTERDYPRDACVHELFQEQVKRTPEALAVIFGDNQLTYRTLSEKADRFAHYLRNNGVGPEALVAICMERSLEMIICVIGILKAGGAYVPLDPAYPRERLDFILEDSGARLLITRTGMDNQLHGNKTQVIILDEAWSEIEKESTANLPQTASPENLAYLLYTSGSTGRPKGVAMPHGPLCNLISWQMENSCSSCGTKTLQFASLNFDVSFQEIFSTLCSGGTLMIAPAQMRRDPVSLLHYIEKESIGRIFLPFVALLQLSEVSESYDIFPRGLREVITAGEQLRITPSIAGMFRKLGDCRLYNQYGPTESHVVTSYILSRSPAEWPSLPPIGRPVSNAEIYILDSDQNPVPAGVPGELYVGGACLAREYMNRSELTQERFIPHPFSSDPGARLYKTGDIARYMSDGNIEYLGRSDNQIKVRGYRIEPGEIEAALQRHGAVREAVVVAKGDISGEKRLVAYIVPAQDSAAGAGELKMFLAQKLPDYMVPSAFVVLDSLPLTPSGKIDRRSLPEPDHTMHGQTKTFVPHRNTLESQLTKAWEKVLGIQPIGITDNFFELGGHSLLAVRLASEVRKITRSKFPVMAIFQFPTIEQLAAMLTREGSSVQFSSLVPIQTVGSRPPFFWVHGQQSDTLLPRYLDADQPLYGLLHQGQDGNVLYSTVEEIAAHYMKEIRAVQPRGPYLLGGYCFGAMVALEMAQQLLKLGEQVSLLFMLDPPKECFPFRALPDAPLPTISAFRSRIVYHSENLAHMPYGKKIAYAMQKLPNAIRLIEHQITKGSRNRGRIAICRLYLALGRPLPPALRSFYLIAIYREAIHEYRPEWYPGRAIVCHSDKVSYGSPLEVNRLTAGGVEEYIVPGAGHEDIIDEPHVRVWAPYLRKCLGQLRNKD